MEQINLGTLPKTKREAKALGLKRYFTGKPCSRGHVTFRHLNGNCNGCNTDYTYAKRAAKVLTTPHQCAHCKEVFYRSAIACGAAPRYCSDACRLKEGRKHRKAWCLRHPGLSRDCQKRHSQKLHARVANSLRTRTRLAIRRQLAGKRSSTEQLTGLPWPGLKLHLESQFQPSMAWDNYGEWHIDHIRPCASFDLTDPEQQRQCFHYSNLQPLWALDNLKKGARVA